MIRNPTNLSLKAAVGVRSREKPKHPSKRPHIYNLRAFLIHGEFDS